MRSSWISLSLSLALLLLCAGIGYWFLHREVGEDGGASRGVPAASPAADSPPDGVAAGEDGARQDEPGTSGAAAGDEASEELDADDRPVSIAGRITDPGGSPVPGARVAAVERAAIDAIIERDARLLDRAPLDALRAFQRSLEELARRLPACDSDAGGRYALRGLPEGDHRLVVRHPGYVIHAGEDWLLVENDRTVRHDIELAAGAVIAGQILDRDGQPVPGVRVRAGRSDAARLKGFGKLLQVFIEQSQGALLGALPPVESDARGAFRLESLAPGAYDIQLTKERYRWGEASGVATGTEDLSITLSPALQVVGRVVAEGGPIAGVALELRAPDPDVQGPAGPLAATYSDIDLFGEKRRRAATDEAGRFSLDAVQTGDYELLVQAAGYPEHRRPLSLSGDVLDLGDVPVAAGQVLSGVVLSPDGAPVAGAVVWVPRAARAREDEALRRYSVLEAGSGSNVASAPTDERGAFRLEGLVGQAVELAVSAEGYPTKFVPRVPLEGRAVTLTLERGLRLRCTVVRADNSEPLAGAQVSFVGEPLPEQVTDNEGRFEAQGVPGVPGQPLDVHAVREGFRDAHATLLFPDPRETSSLEVKLALRPLTPEEEGPSIAGVVRGAAGEPLAGALVWAEVPGYPQVLRRMEGRSGVPKEARTDADGAFRVRVPQIGGTSFEVVASFPGFATSRAGPYPQQPGESGWPAVELRLDQGAEVEGRIAGPRGEPVVGARVRLWRWSQLPQEATLFTKILPEAAGEVTYTTRDGTFRRRRLQSGSYGVEVVAQGYATRTAGPVEVLAGASATRMDLALDAGHSLAGRVVDQLEAPLAGIEVVAIPLAASADANLDDEDDLSRASVLGAGRSLTGSDGGYRIDHLPEGAYRVLARARGFESAWIEASLPGASLPDLVLVQQARLRGRVRDAASGSPVGAFALRLERRDAGGEYAEVPRHGGEVLDANGRFARDGLEPGDWRVSVLASDRRPWQREARLEPGATVDVDAELEVGGRIAGVVLRSDGAPVVGAAITVQLEAQRREVATARSGEDGAFACGGLEAGVYNLHATHPQHYAEGAEGAAKVDLATEADVAVRLTLRPAGRILGHVRGLSFQPPGHDSFVVTFTPVAGAPAQAAFQLGANEDGTVQMESVRPATYRLELTHRRLGPDTGGEWLTLPPERRPLGEVEVRAGETATFDLQAE